MGHPIAPLAWLANVRGEQGVALEAGQLILPPLLHHSHASRCWQFSDG